jgi:glucose/arabinose dehydrogenase
MKKFSCLSLLLVFAFLSWKPVEESLSPIKIKLKLITKGFTSPVGMASPKDGTNRVFVVEQGGKIKIIKNGTLLPVPFINISDKLDGLNIAYSEKGLLGLAFHPDYKNNGRFFVYYSAPFDNKGFDHKSVLAEYKVSPANPDLALTTGSIILEIPEPESNHNGGCLQFGKDGYLYIGVGDGGGAGDQHGSMGNGQNLTTLLGKILRIDVNPAKSGTSANKPYAIPADNPFLNIKNAQPEIYAYGLRNPWRFSFDRIAGTLYCADVGQDEWEEVDVIEKGKNYGWRIMEARHCFNPSSNCNTSGLTLPIDEYSHQVGISICGGYMYRGAMFPSLHGTYFFSDWSGKMFYLKQQTDRTWKRGEVIADDNKTNDMGAKINSMGEDENGEVYIITQHLMGPKSPTGAVYRISL